MMLMNRALNLPIQDLLQRKQARVLKRCDHFGIGALKEPKIYWVHQEIIYEQLLNFFTEIGNLLVGNPLALANMCNL